MSGSLDRAMASPAFNMGMGILASNQGNYGATGPALGRGAIIGMQNLGEMQQAQAVNEYKQAQIDKMKREQQMDAWKQQMLARYLPGGMPQVGGEMAGGPQAGPEYLRQAPPDMLDALHMIGVMDGNTNLLLGVEKERRERAMMDPRYMQQKAQIENTERARVEPPIQTQDEYGRTVYTPRLQYGMGQGPGAGSSVGPSPTRIDALKEGNTEMLRKTIPSLNDQAQSAKSLQDNIRGMRELNLSTGWGTQTMGAAANVLGTLGVKDAQKFAGKVQDFNKLSMDRLWEQLNMAKGPQTEGDAERARQTYAKLENQPEANAFILDYMDAVSQKLIDKASFFEKGKSIVMDPKNTDVDLSQISTRWRKHDRSIWEYPQMQKWKGYWQ